VARSEHPESIILSLLTDSNLVQAQKCDVAANLKSMLPDDRSLPFIRTCVQNGKLASRIRDIMSVYAARYGDGKAFECLVQHLGTAAVDIAASTIALLGHYRCRALGVKAAALIRARGLDGADLATIARSALTGMRFVFEMVNFNSGVLKPCSPHPACDVWAELVDSWTEREDLSPVQRLRVLIAASQLGSLYAPEALKRLLISTPSFDESAFDEDDNGHHIRDAIEEIKNRRRLLPLSVAERLARARRPNVPYAAVSMIAAHSTREALEALLRLYADFADWVFRDLILSSIEILSGRLGLTIRRAGDDRLTISARDPEKSIIPSSAGLNDSRDIE